MVKEYKVKIDYIDEQRAREAVQGWQQRTWRFFMSRLDDNILTLHVPDKWVCNRDASFNIHGHAVYTASIYYT